MGVMNFVKYLKISIFNIPDLGQLLKWQDIESNVVGYFCYLILKPLHYESLCDFSDTVDKKNWCYFESLICFAFLA